MSTPTWAPGTLYNPGALVVPRTAPPVGTDPPTNANFENGDSDWTKGTGWSITNADGSFDGSWAGAYPSPTTGSAELINNLRVPVTPGLVINAQCMINTTGNSVSSGGAAIRVIWYDASHAEIMQSEGNIVRGGGSAWYASGITTTAPSSAAFAAIGVNAFRNSGPHNILVDAFTWDYAFTTPPAGLIFKAVQTDAGFSANTEPTWPTTLGNTVVDGQVTWEAVIATQVTYTAHAILKSGSVEPTWPTVIGGSVADNTIIWQAISGVIPDAKCPNTAAVAIAASKVFAGDVDIIPFCATVNPLDWSTKNDAGYLPFGLQTYGSQPVAALGLYRGNLVAFNSTGFQMWQVDQDPANMALLDAVPVSCTYPKTVQPIANDLIFLNAKGVRNISIAGASTNLQANGVGQPIDSLVQPLVKAGTDEPIGLYWPFMGQYWLIFGAEVFVLTINGANARSWSRYVFPEIITDWTLDGNDLVLRTANHKIWRMDADLTRDDVIDPISVFTAGTPSNMTAGEDIGSETRIGFTDAFIGSQSIDLVGQLGVSTLYMNAVCSITPNQFIVSIQHGTTIGQPPSATLFSSVTFTDRHGTVQRIPRSTANGPGGTSGSVFSGFNSQAGLTLSGRTWEWDISGYQDFFADTGNYFITFVP